MPVGIRMRAFVGVVIAGLGLMSSVSSASAVTTADWRSVTLDVQLVRAAGTTFAYAEIGSGPPLLLLNGTASPMSEWDPAFLAALARDARVIVFDYPGLGESGAAPQPWTFARASDWVADFITRVSPSASVNVLGWSMGGFIAQQLAIRHPETVGALVLAATNPGGSRTQLGPTWVQEIDSSSSSEADYLRTNYPPRARATGVRFLERLAQSQGTGAYPPTVIPVRTLRAMVAAEDPWLRSDGNLRLLSTISARTLVIVGARDLITPSSNSAVIASRIPGASLHVFPSSGHSFLFQRPEFVASFVSDFIVDESRI